MQVADHAGCLQQGVSHLFIAAPSAFDGEGNGVDVEETVAAGPDGIPIVSRMSRIVVTARSSIRRF